MAAVRFRSITTSMCRCGSTPRRSGSASRAVQGRLGQDGERRRAALLKAGRCDTRMRCERLGQAFRQAEQRRLQRQAVAERQAVGLQQLVAVGVDQADDRRRGRCRRAGRAQSSWASRRSATPAGCCGKTRPAAADRVPVMRKRRTGSGGVVEQRRQMPSRIAWPFERPERRVVLAPGRRRQLGLQADVLQKLLGVSSAVDGHARQEQAAVVAAGDLQAVLADLDRVAPRCARGPSPAAGWRAARPRHPDAAARAARPAESDDRRWPCGGPRAQRLGQRHALPQEAAAAAQLARCASG